MNCPCQSGEKYDACCGRFISHHVVVENAEKLMRSRFTAYALNEVKYLIETWHPDYRPEEMLLDDNIKWLRLEIKQTSSELTKSEVQFEALFLLDGRVETLHEKSQFIVEDGQWFYTSGEALESSITPWKPGRNESCPCGSGQKFKRCCGK